MPNPWDRLLNTEDAYSDLQRSLASQYASGLYQLTPQGESGGYTVSTFGPQGPRHIRTDFDPITQRFYSAGAGFHPSWLGGVQTSPTQAMSGFVGALIQGSTEPMPQLQDPFAYQRSQYGEGFSTGGPVTPEWASWQRAQHFMGAEPLDPGHSTPWSYLKRRAEFPESYPTVSGLGRQASGFQYGPLLTHASAFQAIPGMGTRGSGVDTSIVSSYGGHKPREKLGLEDPGRLFNIWGETLRESKLTGTQETYDPSGGAIRRSGVERNVEFAPGFLFPGAGQSYGLASAFRRTELGQGKTFTTPLSYDQMTTWAMKTGRPVAEISSYMYDRAQRPNQDFAEIMGFGVGMNPQARRGTSSYIPQSATLNLPYGPELGALVQQYAADVLPKWQGSEIGGHGVDILSTYPKTAEEQYSYTSWLNVLQTPDRDANWSGLSRAISSGGQVEFFPGEKGAQPFLTTGYEQLSPWTSGHALQMQGVKSVMTMYQDLQAMGAESKTEILLGGESVKGTPFMAEQLVNALGAEQMIQLGVPESAFEGGILRGGAQPEVISAMRSMFTDPNIRPEFEQALQAAGGSIQTKWMSPPVDPSWIEMMQPGGALASQVVREKAGAAVGSFFLGEGRLEQRIETMMLPSIVAPTESPQRGNIGGFNLNDLIAMSQNNPEVAGAFYNRARETAAPYASLIMAASGLLPPEAETTRTVGAGGVVLPVERARSLAAAELEGSPLAAMYGPGGTEPPPLKFMLQAMAAEGSPFRGKFMPIESDLGKTAYLPPAEDLLKTQTFTSHGGAVSAVGFKLETMLNRIGTSTKGATPEIAAYMGALTKEAQQQGVVSGAFMGKTEASMTGRLQYIGGVDLGGKPGVVVPDPEYGRIMESLGAEGTNEQAMAAFLRWPDAGEHAIFGDLMSASQAAKAQRASGTPAIDPRTFRGIGFTGRSAELVQETYADVDKDVGTVVAELVSRVPGLEVAGELRTKFMTSMENLYPEAIPGATKALAGVMGVTPDRVTPDMLSTGAILSYAEGGKARESIQPALDFGKLSSWAEEKMIEPRDISLRQLGDVRASEALGKGFIGLASNFGDMMRFYMSEQAGVLEGREAEVYKGEAQRAQQQLLGIKQSLVDTNLLPNVPEGGSAFANLSQAGQGLFGPMTSEMWRRAGSRAGDITQGVIGQYEERGGRIFPARAAVQESELLTGFASAAMKQGMDVRGVAALLGGQERMEQDAPGMYNYLLKTSSEDVQTRAQAVFPFEGGQSEEFRDWFRKTPLGSMIYGQGAFRAGGRVLDIEDRMAQGKEIPEWEMKFLQQARPDLESGYWDPEVGQFIRSRATLGPGGRARMLTDPLAEYNPRGRLTGQQFVEGLHAQVTSGLGITSDILAQTPLGQVGQQGRLFSQVMRDNPPPALGAVRRVPMDDEQIAASAGRPQDAPRQAAANADLRTEAARLEQMKTVYQGRTLGQEYTHSITTSRAAAEEYAGPKGLVVESQIPVGQWESAQRAQQAPNDDLDMMVGRDPRGSTSTAQYGRVTTQAAKAMPWIPAGTGGLGKAPPGPPPTAVGGQFMGTSPSAGESGGRRPSRAQIEQDLGGVMAGQPAYRQNAAQNAFSRTGQGGANVAWSGGVTNVMSAVFAGIPLDDAMIRAYEAAGGPEWIRTPMLEEISGLVRDPEAQVSAARYGTIQGKLRQPGRRYGSAGATEVRPFADDFLTQLRQRGYSDSKSKAPAGGLSPEMVENIGQAQEAGARYAARGFERLTGEDLGALTAEIKEVTENLGKMNITTKEAQEIMTTWKQVDSAIQKFGKLQEVPAGLRDQGWQNEAARAYASATTGMGALMGAGGVGGVGGPPGIPPVEDREPGTGSFGERLGRAGTAFGRRFGGEQRVATFFDLMYLGRVGSYLTGGMREDALGAQEQQMAATQAMGGALGVPTAMPGFAQRVQRERAASLNRGMAWNQVWGQGQGAMSGIAKGGAGLSAVGGPAAQSFLIGGFVNQQFLGGEFPSMGPAVGLATAAAGLGMMGYNAYTNPEEVSTMRTMNKLEGGGLLEGPWLQTGLGGMAAFAAEMFNPTDEERGNLFGMFQAGSRGFQEYGMGEEGIRTMSDAQIGVIRGGMSQVGLQGLDPELRGGAMVAAQTRFATRTGLDPQTYTQLRSMAGPEGFSILGREGWGGWDAQQNFEQIARDRGQGERELGRGQFLEEMWGGFAATGGDISILPRVFEAQSGMPWTPNLQADLLSGDTAQQVMADPQRAELFAQGTQGINRIMAMSVGRSLLPEDLQTPEDMTPVQLQQWGAGLEAVTGSAGVLMQAEIMGAAPAGAAGAFAESGARQASMYGDVWGQRLLQSQDAITGIAMGGMFGRDMRTAEGGMTAKGWNMLTGAIGISGTQDEAGGLRVLQQMERGNPLTQAAFAQDQGLVNIFGVDPNTAAPLFERSGDVNLGVAGTPTTAAGWARAAGVDPMGRVGQAFAEGGLVETRRDVRRLGFEQSWAKLGISEQRFADQGTFQQAQWGVQDQMTALSRGFQDFQWELGGRRMDTQEQQFGQSMAFQRQQAGVQADWGRQDVGTAVGRTDVQRQWRREDWGVQDDMRAMQWGWQQQDFQENIRFSTGRQRRLGIREQERATVVHQAEDEQIDRDRGRMEQKEAWEDEDFSKQRSRHEVRVEWQNERFDLTQQHFDENMALNREAHDAQREFTLEMRELEDELRDLTRDHWKEQREFTKQQLAMQGAMLTAQEELFDLSNMQADVIDEGKKQQDLITAGLQESAEATQNFTQELIQMMATMGQPFTGGENDPFYQASVAAGVNPYTGDELWEGLNLQQFGGAAIPGQASIVGEGGVAELFIPDSAGRVTPFAQGETLVDEFFSQIGSLGDSSGALVTIMAIKDLVEALDRTSPDRVREVDTLLKVLAT